MRFVKTTLVLAIFIFSICTSITYSAPMNGINMSLIQPDNTTVPVHIYGDEYYQRMESIDGYTVMYDTSNQWISYANLDSTNTSFVSTGVKYTGIAKPSTLTIPTHLKESNSVIESKVAAERTRLQSTQLLQKETQPKLQRNVAASNAGVLSATPPTSVVGLTILIDFPDQHATIPQADISNMINQVGYTGHGNNGSVRDYFYDISNGALTYTNTVTAYYRAKNNKTYYDSDEPFGPKACELINEALTELDKTYDFSNITKDSNGEAVSLNVFYAGWPLRVREGLWQHTWNLSKANRSCTADGVKFDRYEITPIGYDLSIGVFCHENCHMILGYPDLYDYGNESAGVGCFDVMAYGDDKNPPPPCPYLRNNVSGFGKAIPLDNTAYGSTVSLIPNSINSYIYRGPVSTEYYMIESINKTGRYSTLPGSGLLIWHIDENGSNDNQSMTPSSHYQVSVVQADGHNDLETNANHGNPEDFFYTGTNFHRNYFGFSDYPTSNWWSGNISYLNIANVNATGTSFVFNPSPYFNLASISGAKCHFSSSAGSGIKCAIYRKYAGTADSPSLVDVATSSAIDIDTLYG
ncbi:MAG TPA: M6 family metalloprotease domain-containing protein, partial [Clostridia bacterium]